jgi:hypothetical protein
MKLFAAIFLLAPFVVAVDAADEFNYTYYTMQHKEDGGRHHQEGWVAVCQRHCHLDGGVGIHSALINACGAYAHEMPKPKM